jgi:acetoin utilization deacetylase AcuC-like enzyme
VKAFYSDTFVLPLPKHHRFPMSKYRLPRVLDVHRPDLVFYLAGADPYEGDRLGRLKLTVDGLLARDRRVFAACRERKIPVAVAMSGGYAPDVEATSPFTRTRSARPSEASHCRTLAPSHLRTLRSSCVDSFSSPDRS